jgi:hypothetical protein
MMMTSFMVMGSGLGMEGWAGPGAQYRPAIRAPRRQRAGIGIGIGIGEKVAHHCVDRLDNAAFDIAGRPGET